MKEKEDVPRLSIIDRVQSIRGSFPRYKAVGRRFPHEVTIVDTTSSIHADGTMPNEIRIVRPILNGSKKSA